MFLVDTHARTGEGGMVVFGCVGISVHVVMLKCVKVLHATNYYLVFILMAARFYDSFWIGNSN